MRSLIWGSCTVSVLVSAAEWRALEVDMESFAAGFDIAASAALVAGLVVDAGGDKWRELFVDDRWRSKGGLREHSLYQQVEEIPAPRSLGREVFGLDRHYAVVHDISLTDRTHSDSNQD